jgi:cytochrome c oxidase subunit 3
MSEKQTGDWPLMNIAEKNIKLQTMEIDIDEEMRQTRRKVAKNLLWLGIVGIIMLFAGFTSAYVVRQAKGDWQQFTIPFAFFVSTAFIVLSSATMNWALSSAKKNELKNIKNAMLLTLLLGSGFVFSQYWGWKSLINQHTYFTGPGSNASGQYFYIITFMHLLHLLGGIIAVLVVFFKALTEKYNANDFLGIELCAIYWHFLDILWIYLFLFLYFIH